MIVPFCIGNFFEMVFLTNTSATDIFNISLDDISGNDKFKEEGIILEKKQIAMTEAVYYILLSLQTPNHGYGIIQNIIQMTEGRLELGAGTLYGAINTLLDKGWIQLYSEDKHSRKKKQYLMTEEGRQALRQEIKRLEELLENGRRFLGEEVHDEKVSTVL